MSRNDTPDGAPSVVSGSAIISAGIASAGAATITSRFGVAGTLMGTALAAMMVTGGAAILKAYLEHATGKVRGVSGRIRSRKARRYYEPDTVPDRPDLRNNFVGRMRASLGWFSHLPSFRRRSILIKGLIAAIVAFFIAMVMIYGAERVIGNSLSCGFWSNCPYGATPGLHPLGYGGTGAGPSVKLGGSNAGVAPSGGGSSPLGGGSGQQNQLFGGGGQQSPSSAQPDSASGSSSASASSSAEPDSASGSSSASASSSAEPQSKSSASPSSAPPK